jgi:hypothetical protein
MQIEAAADVLAHENLAEPELNVLLPNEDNYTVLLIQPRGQIESTDTGVHHRDPSLARRQFGKFLEDAKSTQADLVITPEYSLPWATLIEAITKKDTTPTKGKLWVLGCESIKYCELDAVRNELAPFAATLYEKLDGDSTRFTDPLAYVFLAPPASGHGNGLKPVVLVQFKTCAMGGDARHFETNGLQRGSLVYQFGTEQKLRLISLICSDALAFEDQHAKGIYRQSLIIHIQLNRNPRHPDFRRYRDHLFSYEGDATEVICLNWARDVEEWKPDGKEDWRNIGGSAWYLRPDRFGSCDQTLQSNHRLGLYYTWLKDSRAHALFFNYQPAVYKLIASKVAHIGVLAVKSYRRGPQLILNSAWCEDHSAWVAQTTVDDGFPAVVGESGNANEELKRIAADNPLQVERILALCSGQIASGDEWYEVDRLDSCVIDSCEVIRRLTFCQDTDAAATGFLHRRLRLCGILWNILMNPANLPPALKDLKDGFHYQWSLGSPHQNVLSVSGQRATAVYVGEDSGSAQLEKTKKNFRERLRRSFADADDRAAALDRLAIWYRNSEGAIALVDFRPHCAFDKMTDVSEYDIAREK